MVKDRSIYSKAALLWKLQKSEPNQMMSLDEAEELLSLFRLQTEDVPRAYRTLWLIEEARAKIAIRSLQCRHWNMDVKAFVSLFYLHIRLTLLMKAARYVELARDRANLSLVAEKSANDWAVNDIRNL